MKKNILLLAVAVLTAMTVSAQTQCKKDVSTRCESCAPKVCEKKCSPECKPDCSDCQRRCAVKKDKTKLTKKAKSAKLEKQPANKATKFEKVKQNKN